MRFTPTEWRASIAVARDAPVGDAPASDAPASDTPLRTGPLRDVTHRLPDADGAWSA